MRSLIEVPVCLVGKGDNIDKEVTARIDPATISGYYPGYHWGSVIMMNSGAEFLTTLSCEQIDERLSFSHFKTAEHASS